MNPAPQPAAPRSRIRPWLKRCAWRLSPALFESVLRRRPRQEFSIGIYRGPCLCGLSNQDAEDKPVLTRREVTDMPADFVADPFMIRADGEWHMFFEAMDAIAFKGCVALASSPDAHQWRYRGVVLDEPFHLAYPQVFEWQGGYYMIPDSPDQGVLLYRATGFPKRWERCAHLFTEPAFSDSSIFFAAGRLWLLTLWRRNGSSALRLFHADQPTGPWQEHPASPVVQNDDGISRPGGRPVIVDGVPIRFAQDCAQEYGKRVRAFRITRLDELHYEERELSASPILQSGPAAWHGHGMHHVDAHRLSDGRWVACVDGW